MSTSTSLPQVFRPERHLNHLIVFRPLEYLEEWDDGFGKLKPAVVSEWAVLARWTPPKDISRVEQLRTPDLPLTLVPVKEPEVRLETLKHTYLVQALWDSAGQGVLAGYLLRAGTSFVLTPRRFRSTATSTGSARRSPGPSRSSCSSPGAGPELPRHPEKHCLAGATEGSGPGSSTAGRGRAIAHGFVRPCGPGWWPAPFGRSGHHQMGG